MSETWYLVSWNGVKENYVHFDVKRSSRLHGLWRNDNYKRSERFSKEKGFEREMDMSIIL